jgi:hypothetical protein
MGSFFDRFIARHIFHRTPYKNQEAVPKYRFPKLLIKIVSLLESVNTSAGINKFLLTGEKRMAFRTNINADIFFSRTSFVLGAASTFYGRLFVLGMYAFFHYLSPLSGIHIKLHFNSDRDSITLSFKKQAFFQILYIQNHSFIKSE